MRLDLLDLPLDICQPLLDGECIGQALCLAQQRQQTILLGAEILESRRGIHIIIRDILNRLVEIVQRAVVRLGVSREIGKDLWIRRLLPPKMSLRFDSDWWPAPHM